MVSKFSRRGKPQDIPTAVMKPLTDYDVLKAMPEFVASRERDRRERRLNHGITTERLLAKLQQQDPRLTEERLLNEFLYRLQRCSAIRFGLFPTPMGSEQGWRKCR